MERYRRFVTAVLFGMVLGWPGWAFAAATCGDGDTEKTTNLGLCKTDAEDSAANLIADMHANWEEIDSSSVGTTPVTQGGTGTTTQFTQGSAVFAGASGVYTQDNTGYFYDDTNNRLGLGTTSPGATFEARADSASEIPAIVRSAASPTVDLFQIENNGTDKFIVDKDGDVGVNTTSPAARLHAVGPAVTGTDIAIKAEDSFIGLLWESSNANYRSSVGHTAGSAIPFMCLNCEHSTGANTFRNDDSGNRGILFTASNELQIIPNPTTTAADEFAVTDSPTLTVESTEVGVNTANPTEALDVTGKIQLSDLTAPGADPMCWDGSGASTIGDCTSLRKWKTDIKDLPEELGLDTVLKMRPVTYTWVPEKGGKQDLGFVAEDVEAVHPLIASYTDEGLSGVKFGHYTAALTKAIQQLKEIIDHQEKRIQELEVQNARRITAAKRIRKEIQDDLHARGCDSTYGAIHHPGHLCASR